MERVCDRVTDAVRIMLIDGTMDRDLVTVRDDVRVVVIDLVDDRVVVADFVDVRVAVPVRNGVWLDVGVEAGVGNAVLVGVVDAVASAVPVVVAVTVGGAVAELDGVPVADDEGVPEAEGVAVGVAVFVGVADGHNVSSRTFALNVSATRSDAPSAANASPVGRLNSAAVAAPPSPLLPATAPTPAIVTTEAAAGSYARTTWLAESAT